jgi:hypothetical protein
MTLGNRYHRSAANPVLMQLSEPWPRGVRTEKTDPRTQRVKIDSKSQFPSKKVAFRRAFLSRTRLIHRA